MRTIKATVSDRTLQKVGRFFDSSLNDILIELMQNSRRAGATRIDFRTWEGTDGLYLGIEDNGVGIEDPSIILNLGQSDWDEDIEKKEDPAGFGFFSLSGRKNVVIYSRDWMAELPPNVFTGEGEATVQSATPIQGTRISFLLTEKNCESTISRLALYFPLLVTLNDVPQEQRDYLHDCYYIEEWRGLRLGVAIDPFSNYWRSKLNFYGLTLGVSYDSPIEGRFVKIDVVDCPELKLVLPARKEIVRNKFAEELELECERVLFRYFASIPSHSLSYRDWLRAKELGVDLPEATPEFREYTPHVGYSGREPEVLTEAPLNALLVNHSWEMIAENLFYSAWDEKERERLVTIRPKFVGYSWSRLPQVTDINFFVQKDGEFINDQNIIEAGERYADSIHVEMTIEHPESGLVDTVQRPIAVYFPDENWNDRYYPSCGYDIAMAIAKDAKISPRSLADLITDCHFYESEDRDSGSLDEQYNAYFRDALERARQILLDEDEAKILTIQDDVKALLHRWDLHDSEINIQVHKDWTVDVRFSRAS